MISCQRVCLSSVTHKSRASSRSCVASSRTVTVRRQLDEKEREAPVRPRRLGPPPAPVPDHRREPARVFLLPADVVLACESEERVGKERVWRQQDTRRRWKKKHHGRAEVEN